MSSEGGLQREGLHHGRQRFLVVVFYPICKIIRVDGRRCGL